MVVTCFHPNIHSAPKDTHEQDAQICRVWFPSWISAPFLCVRSYACKPEIPIQSSHFHFNGKATQKTTYRKHFSRCVSSIFSKCERVAAILHTPDRFSILIGRAIQHSHRAEGGGDWFAFTSITPFCATRTLQHVHFSVFRRWLHFRSVACEEPTGRTFVRESFAIYGYYFNQGVQQYSFFVSSL